jgi:uncharacterized protein (DUF2225 family)
MASNQKPTFSTNIECPVCRNVNEFENLKNGAYTENGRDSDFCPAGRVWSDPEYQKYNPLIFNFTVCPTCFYSRELNASFKEWNSDNNFKQYRLPGMKTRHQQILSQPNNMFRQLGSAINQHSYPFETAVIKILLAIYEEEISEKPGTLDIARYFVRIAWLFRERGGGPPVIPDSVLVTRAQTEASWLKEHSQSMRNKLEVLHKIGSSELTNDKSSPMNVQFMGEYTTIIANLDRINKEYAEEVQGLQSAIDGLRNSGISVDRSAQEVTSFGPYSDFTQFLSIARKQWNEVPLNESDAINNAINYYLKAYQNGREIKKGLQQLQAAYLIAELSRRVGRSDTALEYFKICMRESRPMLQQYASDKSTIAGIRKIMDMVTDQYRLMQGKVEALV